MRRISVGDVMTRKIISAKPESTLHECAKIMAKEKINSLPITQENKLIGFLTSKDIFKVLTKNSIVDLKKIKAIEVATRKVAVIKPSADISQALEKMKALNFRRLPVISKGELIGMLTLKDILAIEPQMYSEMKNLMDEIKEEERKIRESEAQWPLEGLCENCGAFSELLKIKGQLLCPDCRDELY